MIELREMTASDSDQVRRWRNLPEVARFMFTDHVVTPEEHAAWFDRALRDATCRYWIIVADGEDIGLANLTGIDHHHGRCSWGMYLASPLARGSGIGSYVLHFLLSYAFESLQLNKVSCEILAMNEASLAMSAALGFTREGVLREHRRKGSELHDVVQFSMLRREWVTRRPDIEERLRRKGLGGPACD